MVKRFLPLLLLLLLAAPAAALTAEVGETYIRWEWTEQYGPETMLYVDGVNQSTAAGRQTLLLTDLNPAEEHQLVLLNTTSATPAAALRVKTLASLSTVLFFIAVQAGIALLCVLLQDPARVILTGALGSVIGFFLFGLCVGHGALWLVVLALTGFQALFTVLALYTLLEEALRWW